LELDRYYYDYTCFETKFGAALWNLQHFKFRGGVTVEQFVRKRKK